MNAAHRVTPDDEQAQEGMTGNVSTFIETIVEASEDAIITKTLDGMVMSWNKAAEEIFGYTSDEMVGDSIMVLFPPDRVDEEKFMLNNIKEGRRVKHFETVRLRKDGRPIHVSVTLSPIKDADGRVIGAAKIARDITERVKLEQMASHYQAVIQSSFDAVITETLGGIVTTWNPAADRIFEFSAKEMIGETLSAIIPLELLKEEERILQLVGDGKRIQPFDTVRCTKSGKRLAVSVTASPVLGADGLIHGVSKIVRLMGDQSKASSPLSRNTIRLQF